MRSDGPVAASCQTHLGPTSASRTDGRRKQVRYVNDSNKELSARFAKGVMGAVRETGVLIGADDATNEYAASVISAELEAFFGGKGAYGDALRAVALGTKPEGSAIAMVVTACTQKIALHITTGTK